MKIIGLIFGILAAFGMIVGFVPLLGWFNWLNIPFALIGLVVNILALSFSKKDEPKAMQAGGIILCAVAMVFGLIRLILGAGII
jgi:hypothetical protein